MSTIALDRIEDELLHPRVDLRELPAREQFARITARVASMPNAVVEESDLLERLEHAQKTQRPLKVKLGIDPTGPDIHIGHAVPLLNLRLFQRCGHEVELVIGDFTGMIGDPSGRSSDRPPLTPEQMRENMATYEAQAARVIDLSGPHVHRHYNSEWMRKIDLLDWVGFLKRISVTELLQREDFRQRQASGHGLSLAELEYAAFMGYDSVVLQPDIELGGVDQYLNLHMCRKMMSLAHQRPEIIIAYDLLPGTSGEYDADGRLVKMSKSRNNYIPITTTPEDMYGKVMSIPDAVMWIWFRELTEIRPDDLEAVRDAVEGGTLHPKRVKQMLARVIVATFNGFDVDVVKRAEADFESKFGRGKTAVPETTIDVRIALGEDWVEAIARAAAISKNQLQRLFQEHAVRRLTEQGFVPVDRAQLGEAARDSDELVLRIGKRTFLRLRKAA